MLKEAGAGVNLRVPEQAQSGKDVFPMTCVSCAIIRPQSFRSKEQETAADEARAKRGTAKRE
jgi:hypothetical protein